MNQMTEPLGPNNLLLVRTLKSPRALIWRCWTEPELLRQWFCPKPWQTIEATIDLRAGGQFYTLMAGPDGERNPSNGCFLEVVPLEKLVFTDLMSADWQPEAAFLGFTATVSFRDLPDGGTSYTALAKHRSPSDRDRHAEMGFEGGWGTAARQLDDLAMSLV